MKLIHESLLGFNIKCRASDPATLGTATSDVQLRLRIGGLDRRKVRFKGWITVENFVYGDVEGSFVVMQRDEVIVSLLTHAVASEWYQIPGFTIVLATVVESINRAQRHLSTCFKEITFIPCANHIALTCTFTTFIRRARVSYLIERVS